MSKFKIYKGKDANTEECWRWKLIDDNGANIAKSEEPFLKENIKESIKKIQEYVGPRTSIVLDSSDDEKGNECRFSYFQSTEDGQWYWRLQAAGNNEKLAVGGEGFVSEGNVKRSIENVRGEMCVAGIGFENPEDDPAYDAQKENEDEKTNIKKGIPGSGDFDSLEGELEKAGMGPFVITQGIGDLPHPILIFIDYQPKNRCTPVCLGLPLEEYEQKRMARKFWSSVKTAKPVNGQIPNPHPEYKEFNYEGRTYYPFSADLSGYNFSSASISELLEELYEHVGSCPE